MIIIYYIYRKWLFINGKQVYWNKFVNKIFWRCLVFWSSRTYFSTSNICLIILRSFLYTELYYKYSIMIMYYINKNYIGLIYKAITIFTASNHAGETSQYMITMLHHLEQDSEATL
jgi:hypothetical protein